FGGSNAGGDVGGLAERARSLAGKHGVAFVAAGQANAWCAGEARTTYPIDIRTPEEAPARAVARFRHAPGEPLRPAREPRGGVRGARLVLGDDEQVRAPVVAAWLRQLGYEACVLEGGFAAAAALSWPQSSGALPPAPQAMTPTALAQLVAAGTVQILDLRPAM